MRQFRSASILALIAGLTFGSARADIISPPQAPLHPRSGMPGLPPAWFPPAAQAFGADGPKVAAPRGKEKPAPQSDADKAAAKAEALKKALAPKPTPAAMRQQMLSELFTRLAAARDPDEAKGIAGAIEHLWQKAGSDTADLLMERAVSAIQDNHFPLAVSLLDKIVEIEPGWAEAWNKRATARFLADDLDGAMADIDHVLTLEPRHFDAMAGLGAILQKAGFDKRALEVFRRVLTIYPQQEELQKLVDKLQIQVEGQDI